MNRTLTKIRALVQELKVKKRTDAEKYEACETIARLAPQEVVNLINDPKLKEGIAWLKDVHKDMPDVARWTNSFALIIFSLFDEAGGIKKVKKWHALEGLCDKVTEEELKKIDKNLRQTILLIKHVHDRSPEMRLDIIKKINNQTILSQNQPP
ncbi:MAG: hypothetical protein QW315_00260 [Candidatus Hadarchaeum sp.]